VRSSTHKQDDSLAKQQHHTSLYVTRQRQHLT
jgi:hypothetical protein